MIDKVKPFAFCYNIQEYWSLKELIGHYGWSKPELDKDLEKLSTKGEDFSIGKGGSPLLHRSRGGTPFSRRTLRQEAEYEQQGL